MTAREGFLDRWSRLKRDGEAAQAEPQAADAATGAPDAALQDEAPPPSPEDDRPDEEILAELGLPHPDDLSPGDDFRGFMQAAVPDRLRRIALRKLWRSNPTLANLDGLIDHGEDYTDAATVQAALRTNYVIGGRVFAEAEEAMEKIASAVSKSDETAGEPGEAAPDAVENDTGDAAKETAGIAKAADESVELDVHDVAISAHEEVAEEPSEDDEPPAQGARRRMAFTFGPSS